MDEHNDSLPEKCSYSELFCSAFSHIQSEWREMRTRITPNTDTFYAVILKYLKNASPIGIVFLQERHSSQKVEIRWNGEFKGQIFFSNTEQLLLVVLLYVTLEQNLEGRDIEGDNLFLFNTKIFNHNFVLLNIYHANMEKEQLSALTELAVRIKRWKSVF